MESTVRFIDSINKVIKILIGVFAAIMFISTFSEVFARFLLGFSISWSAELSRYLMIYSVFLGAALAIRKQDLIAVEFFSERLTHSRRRKLKLLVYTVCILFFIFIFINGIKVVGDAKVQQSAALSISMSIPYAAIPIGSAALTMNSIAVILELIMNKETRNGPEEGGI